MKRVLAIIVVVALVGTSVPMRPAHAVIPVTDITVIAGQIRSFAQDLKSYALQIKQHFVAAQQLVQEVQSAISLATMVTNFIRYPSLGAALGMMNMAGLDLDLPINPYAVQSLLTGYGGMNSLSGISGKLSTLGSLVTGSYSRDTIYSCTDDSFACVQNQQMAASNAAHKGSIGRLYQSLTTHNAVLNGLRDTLNTSRDPASREGAIGQATVEVGWHVSQLAQIEAVNGLAQAQQQINQQQAIEKINMDAQQFIAQAPQ